MSGKKYIEKIKELIERIETTQWNQIEKAASMIVDVIAAGGVIHVFGAGHTHVLATEMFCRAGGLASVSPVVDPDMMVYFGPNKGSLLERLEGFGRVLFETHDARPGELVIVVSNSGRNPAPIEIALAAKERGLKVIALTSMAFSQEVASRHSSGKRLFEVADLVIDNCSPIGDAIVELEGLTGRVGPTTTVTNAIILNTIVTQVAANLLEKGISPPILLSGNLDVSREHNNRLRDQYRSRIRFYDRNFT